MKMIDHICSDLKGVLTEKMTSTLLQKDVERNEMERLAWEKAELEETLRQRLMGEEIARQMQETSKCETEEAERIVREAEKAVLIKEQEEAERIVHEAEAEEAARVVHEAEEAVMLKEQQDAERIVREGEQLEESKVSHKEEDEFLQVSHTKKKGPKEKGDIVTVLDLNRSFLQETGKTVSEATHNMQVRQRKRDKRAIVPQKYEWEMMLRHQFEKDFKGAICHRLNNRRGRGCDKLHSGCTYIHRCLMCGSPDHGMFQDCPSLDQFEAQLQQLQSSDEYRQQLLDSGYKEHELSVLMPM